MTHTIKFLTFGLSSAILLASCGQSGTKSETTTATDTTKTATTTPAAPIGLKPVGNSPEFPDAQLSIASVSATKQGNDSAKVTFNFTVKNYTLGMQTADTGSKLCNNSAKGQHIHFILDEQPYTALYEPKNEVVLANNTEHYLMAFLSRSYHESIKSKGAALVYHFKIDDKGKLVKMDDPKTPMVFYSRPKGDYIGKDMTNVLLDFYVWNANLSADGYKVKADVTPEGGTDASFTISDWKSNFLNNLPQGKTKVTLTLLDKDGKQVQGPNTTVDRSINLSADEPMKK
ncbi:MAG: hypothetical protein JSS96_09910 [Bacteroidetes bacterium]|nr:hypothetical protein [Bacteroidota bacterium]